MRVKVIGLAVLFLAAGALAAEKKSLFVSHDHKISIEPPASPGAGNLQVAMFFLPASDQFAANVNVQKQSFPGPIDEYMRLSKEQFKLMGISLLKSSVKGDEAVFEYEGEMQGRPLHWLARAIKSGDSVYLVTATGLKSRWNQQKQELAKSVNSFKVYK
jgi:hypothetical protein